MNNRVTRGANFNLTRPDDVELLQWLDSFDNQSDMIKRALRAYIQGGGATEQAAGAGSITSQERGQLVATIASLQQQLELAQRKAAAAPQTPAVSIETPAASAAVSSGPALRPEFIAAVKAAAKPGIRLEDVQHGS